VGLGEILNPDIVQVYWRFSDIENDIRNGSLSAEIKTGADILDQTSGLFQMDDGVLGSGLLVNQNNSGFISEELFEHTDIFNISFWFKTYDSRGSSILAYRAHPDDSNFYLDRVVWIDSEGSLLFGVFQQVTGEVSSEDSLKIKWGGNPEIWPAIERMLVSTPGWNDNAWHHVVCQLSPLGQVIYIDGEENVRAPAVTSAANFSGHWSLASNLIFKWEITPSNNGFIGNLDEIKIETVARDENWIRFMYENQKPGSGLIIMKQELNN